MLQPFGDVLGKIVGGTQVLAEKMNFSLYAVCQEHAPIAVGHSGVDTHLGGAVWIVARFVHPLFGTPPSMRVVTTTIGLLTITSYFLNQTIRTNARGR